MVVWSCWDSCCTFMVIYSILLSKIEFEKIEVWQTRYLTVYAIWMAVVVFVFPLIFGFN